MFAIDRPEVQKFATEKRLDIQVEPNTSKSFITREESDDPYPSLYFRTCLEELTRNYLSYTIAADDSPTLEMEDSKPKNTASLRFPSVEQLDSLEVSSSLSTEEERKSGGENEKDSSSTMSRFLRVYHPHASPQMSNFRRVPLDKKQIVGDWSCGYTKLLVNVGPQFKVRYNKHVFFEPLFGSVSLYSINKKIDTDITKITESFHFDATPPSLRDSYRKVYKTDLDPEDVDKGHEGGDHEKKEVEQPQDINPLSECSRCLFCIPTSILESHDIFLVVQFSKVLSGEPDKALLPYINPDKKSLLGNSSSETQLSHAMAACNRLHRFRQPVGLSAVKVFKADGSVNKQKVGITTPVYTLKHCCNDYTLKGVLQDLLEEQSTPTNRPSSHRVLPPKTELDVCLTFLDLGTGGDLSAIPIPEGMPSVRTASTFHFLPSQYLTEEAANDFEWYTELGKEVADLVSVKTMLPLLHPSCSLTDHSMSGFRASIDNSIFLYPAALENLPKNFRNLSVRVQLIEFEDTHPIGAERESINLDDTPYHAFTVLKNIYSTIPGDLFCRSVYTNVSYHKSNPELNDEIKVRLPLKLNSNHALYFQFFHVHVKNKVEKRRSSIFSAKNSEDQVTTLLGCGHLSLLVNGTSLLPDGEHSIIIVEQMDAAPLLRSSVSGDTSHDSMSSLQSIQTTTNSTRISATRRSLTSSSGHNVKSMPVFTLRTKSLSSFLSQDPDLQDYLTCHPPTLGHLPSLSPAMMKTIEYTVLPKEHLCPGEEEGRELSYNSPQHAVNEDILKEKTMFFAYLGSASKHTKVEVCKHFFGIMRQFTRAMCGGGMGDFSTTFANPFTHSELRCTSFIAMLRVFNIMTPKNAQSGNADADADAETKRSNGDFLRAYVDYMFDEEVYTYISPSKRKFDATGEKITKKTTKSLGVKLAGLFRKSETDDDSSLRRDKEEEEEALLEHVLLQVEAVVLHGSMLSAVGKTSHEILKNGTVVLTPEEEKEIDDKDKEREREKEGGGGMSSLSSAGEDAPRTARWWGGCTELKPLLTEMTESPASLEKLLQSLRQNVNPLKESIVIDPLLGAFDKLDGFSLRSFAIGEELQRKKSVAAAAADKTNSKGDNKPADKKQDPYNYLTLQWWPWMYEVISYQWISLLHIFQEESLDKKKGVAVEEISKIEEEEEGEEEEEEEEEKGGEEEGDGKEPLEWNTRNTYPLNELKDLFVKKNEIRTLLINHGPILLAMIIKSIALRIHREQKNTPVIMDKDFMQLMEELLGTLALEVHSKGTSLMPGRNLNIAISHFLREIFALIAPLQSAQLVYAYFLSSRKTQKLNFEKSQRVQVNHITDRLYFLKELILTDHFFAFNFPLHLGSPHAAYTFTPVFSVKDLMALAPPSSIRGIQSPPSHWLAHLLIYEVMCDFDSLAKNLKESAMKLIRSLVVRLCYDKRFQSREYKHRVAAMFIPLLSCIVEDVKRIQALPPASEERRDSLALVLFILQDIPDYLLREELRNMMKVYGVNPIKLKYRRHVASDTPSSSSTSSSSSSSSSPVLQRDLSMSGGHQHLPIFDLIALFHLVVDTFEFPLSQGGDEGDISACLSPSVHIDGIDNASDTVTSGRTRKGTIGTKERVGTNDALSMLENMNAKRDRRVVRKRTSGDKTTTATAAAGALESSGSDTSSSTSTPTAASAAIRTSPPKTPKSDQTSSSSTTSPPSARNVAVVSVDAGATLRPNRKTGVKQALVGMLNGLNAVKHVSEDSTGHVLKTLRIVIVESMKLFEPQVQSIYCDTKFGPEMSGIISDSLNLLLHLLHTKQSEVAMCQVYQEATQTLTILGAKNFMSSLSADTLQYWVRQVILHCGSLFASLREAAATFLGNLLFSCYDNFGSFRSLSVPVFGVLRDVVDVVEKQYKDRPQMLEEARYLQPFFEAFDHAKKAIIMKETVSVVGVTGGPNNVSKSLLLAVDHFFAAMTGFLNVYSFINLKLDYMKVSFDWKGGNGLDSMDFVETSPHSKSVGFDVRDVILEGIAGIDMEEVFEQMITAAATLADYELPRTRMYVLENLARTHDMLGNNSEGGGARWEIYLTLQQVEKRGMLRTAADQGGGGGGRGMGAIRCYWCPRPPLKLGDTAGDFMTVLSKAIALPAPTAWESEQQFYKQMETVLTVCAKRFKDAKLTFLAERAIQALIECYRREDFDENESLPLIAKAFLDIHELYAQSSVGSTTFAMGTFYRVLFLGKDVSEKIRNHEYVVRNADFLHLSEFQTLIKKNLLLKHVSKDVPISVLPDTSPTPADDASGAFIVMTALKPIFERHGESIFSKNCLRKFQFSVPFTKGGKSHAKTIDLQWKRTIYIEVPHAFPYLTFRQRVSHRTSRDLSPIEVAVDDIQERNEAMRLQLQLKSSKEQMFINNLMRLVQGTVAPQVNAGATEVAKTFLTVTEPLGILPQQLQMRLEVQDSQIIASQVLEMELKVVLVEFLKRSKCLLERARKVLGTGDDGRRASIASSNCESGGGTYGSSSSSSSSDIGDQNTASHLSIGSNHSAVSNSSSGSPNQPPPPPETQQSRMESHHMIWQQEMDRGYDMLLETIFPYVRDIAKKEDIISST